MFAEMCLFKDTRTGSEYFAFETHPSLDSHQTRYLDCSTHIRYTIKMTSEGSDAYINDILVTSDDSDLKEKSEIADFFAHTNILVTGGTGFIGKLLVEKLLRCFPDIVTMYLVVRPKKGKSSLERLKENFDEIIYDKLKHEQPNFFNKVVLVEGDASKNEFGWSPETKKMLMNVNVIFHAAALVRFDEKLRTVMDINVKSTKFLLTFAKHLPNFKAFVHVSTAFAHCIHDLIEEKHYHDSLDVDKLLALLDILDDDKIARLTPILLDKWPNTYVYTKAVGENAVLKYSDDLPVCIVRPSIVLSTEKEPITAWINNLYGPTGVVIGSALGLLHSLHCIPEKIANIIPADYVISIIVAAAWDVSNRNRSIKASQDSHISDEERVPIYNAVSFCQNPISWGEFMKKNEIYGLEVPTTKVLWYYMLILNRHLFVHNICVFFMHIIPAMIVDTIAYLTGRQPGLMAMYKKIQKFSNVIHYFSTRQWNFRNDNVIKIWEKMKPVDRRSFNFDLTTLDWDSYFFTYVRGLRVFLINDPLDTVDEGRATYRKKRILHYTVLTLICLLGLWVIVSLIGFLWSFCPLAH